MIDIDFGHFLGHYKKVLNMRRERAPFVLTPDFANVMGCKGSETFNTFVKLCITGFNILRKHANVFINLFAMVINSSFTTPLPPFLLISVLFQPKRCCQRVFQNCRVKMISNTSGRPLFLI